MPTAPSLRLVERPTGYATGAQPIAFGHGLTRRASLTAVALLLDYGVKLAIGVLITPVLVGALGRPLFGTWAILQRLVGSLSVADGRPMDALRLALANRQAAADAAASRRTVGAALAVWGMCLPLVTVAGALVVWLAPTLVQASPEHVTAIRTTAAVLVVNLVLTSLVRLPEAVLSGANQGYRRMGLLAGAEIAGAGLVVAAINAGLGLVGIAAAQVGLTLLNGALVAGVARRFVHWFGAAWPARAELGSFLRLSFWSLAGDAIAKLTLASDVVILGFLASASAVTSYVLTGYAMHAVVGLLTLAMGAVVPGLAGVVGAGQRDRALAIRREMLATAWLVATVVGAAILLLNRAFLELWVGSRMYAGPGPNVLLVAIMVQTVFIRADAYVINAALRLAPRVVVSGVAAVVSCALAIALVPVAGVTGLCVALLTGRLTQSIAYPVIVNGIFDRPRAFGLSHAVRPALVMAGIFGGSAYAGQHLLADRWIEWAAAGTASVVLVLPVAFLAGLASDYRQSLVSRLLAISRWRSEVSP